MDKMATIELTSTDNHLSVAVSVSNSCVLHDLSINLVEHTDRDIQFFTSMGLNFDGQHWSGTIDLSGSPRSRLLEVVRLGDFSSNQLLDSVNRIFLEPQSNGRWITGNEAEQERQARHESREAYYGSPLVANGASETDTLYRGVYIYDNILLSQVHRVPGISLVPLQNSSLGSDVISVINDLLPQFGFLDALDTQVWMARMQTEHPAIVLTIHVHATSDESAIATIEGQTYRLAVLTAFRRMSSPTFRGGVLARRIGTDQYQGIRWWTGPQTYRGNLLGGFLAGEDQSELLDMWGRLQHRPNVELLMSLYRNALSEASWEYQFFRYYNLLESVGADKYPNSTPVLDLQGHPRLQNNPDQTPYTAAQSRGKVYLLGQEVARSSGLPEDNLIGVTANTPTMTFWEMTNLWVKMRDQIAHRGRWHLAANEVESRRRMRLRIAFENLGGSADAMPGIDKALSDLKELVKMLIRHELRQKIKTTILASG